MSKKLNEFIKCKHKVRDFIMWGNFDNTSC